MRLDGLGVGAAEERVARAANFVADDAVAAEEFNEKSCCGAVHDIRYEAELRVADAIPIDELFEGVEVGSAGIEWLNQFFAGRQWWDTVALNVLEFAFNLRDDGGKGAAAIAGFIFNSVPAIGIVAGGDDQAAGGVALANQQRDRGSGAGLVGQPDRRAACGDNVGDGGGHSVGRKAVDRSR